MKEFIKDFGIIEEKNLLNEIQKYNGIFYALYTNKLVCSKELKETANLLELRIFDENYEVKYRREFVGEEFKFRIIDDNKFKQKLANETDEFTSKFENRIFDEKHYLDIDTIKSNGTNYVTTGGGEYTLPIENAEKISIRNYLDYDENGIAYISDFRIMKILAKGEE
ncbi:MAG: CRISPR-associated protein Csx19 [Oscillospiraceae bacterium]|nr:CRISPR-associated protein Csx19 [Oscillospiraceae bacterium]MDD6086276.1 CRISPR-associated protein Csx19 [Oscillospiraceae bacterium]